MDKIDGRFWRPERRLELINYLKSKDLGDLTRISNDLVELAHILKDSEVNDDGLFQKGSFIYSGLCVPVDRANLLGGLEEFNEFKPCYGRPNIAFWFPMVSSYDEVSPKGWTYPKAIRLKFIAECAKLVQEAAEPDPYGDASGYGSY